MIHPPALSKAVPLFVAIAALLATTFAFGQIHQAEAATNCTVSDPSFSPEEQAFLGLINQYRADNGLGTLASSEVLNQAATWMATDMATNNYLSHTDSLGRDFATRLQQCGAVASTMGENVASGFPTAAQVFAAWQGSAGHNANMLNGAFTQIGIADVNGFWATDFASGAVTVAPPPVVVTPPVTPPTAATIPTLPSNGMKGLPAPTVPMVTAPAPIQVQMPLIKGLR